MNLKIIILLTSLAYQFVSLPIYGQNFRWQQAVDYTIKVSLNVDNHQFEGHEKLIYTNNSPDTLYRVFYHLYFNAFQPGSMMDVRSRNIEDPDSRVMDRISKLKLDEIGYLTPISLKQGKSALEYTIEGTILAVRLTKPILPHTSTELNMKFKGQVPVQIRRSGRDNKEGIDYSMAQWYPKISEYDAQGWHPEPYIAREFYGVWGDFDVSITIAANYVVAASGILQNPNKVMVKHSQSGAKIQDHKKDITYHFIAKNVHDFMWAADPDYVHKTIQVPGGPKMHFFYVEDEKTRETWPQLIAICPKMVAYMNKQFGQYAYSDFFVIQGGDGGMEYPMSTLIVGRGTQAGLISVTMHEMFHSWYQGALATNESLYPWMDEGFTTYAQTLTKAYLNNTKTKLNRSYQRYLALANSGKQEPLTTHADHYNTNTAYGTGAYSMGSLVPYQLAYIMGTDTFHKAFRDYYYTWRFHHPTPTDFERIMEKNADMVLDWFFLDWIGTTKHLDYAISEVSENNGNVLINLINKNQRPMPVEVMVTYTNGNKERFYMPLRMMRGSKKFNDDILTTQLPDWPWTNPLNTISLNHKLSDISKIELDPDHRTMDIDYSNNVWINPRTAHE